MIKFHLADFRKQDYFFGLDRMEQNKYFSSEIMQKMWEGD